MYVFFFNALIFESLLNVSKIVSLGELAANKIIALKDTEWYLQ